MRCTILALLVGAALLSACTRSHTTEEQESAESVKEEKAAAAAESGLVQLSPVAVRQAGIVVGYAGPATIDVTLQLPGEVKADSSRVLVVRPRFAGVVRSLRTPVGALVRRGETVATIQSNESLTDYAVTSSMPGRVVARGAAVGEVVTTDAALLTIVDLSQVWVEFAVYPHQLGTIRQGQSVRITQQSGSGPIAPGRITYVGPLLAEDTRVSVARVILPNRALRWQPGLFVTVTVVVDRAQARVAVPEAGIVRTEEGPVVFVPEGAGFRKRSVAIGRSDGQVTEIVSGLRVNEPVVIKNAFVLKAELEKSEFEE